jgi:hypothetical protein
MPDEPAVHPPIRTENIPNTSGQISAIASANAPFIYFENAPFFGLLNGVGQISLSAGRPMVVTAEGPIAGDIVLVAHLRGNLPAIRALRGALDGILLMAEPKPEGPAN